MDPSSVLVLVLFVGTVLVAPRFLRGGAPSWPRLGVEELAARLQQKGAVVVDVRTPQEFAQGRVPGAKNVPLDRVLGDPKALDAWRDRDVILVCRSGNRSATAATHLLKHGFRVSDLAGGTTAWAAAGRKLEG